MVDWHNVFHLAVKIKQSDIQGKEGSRHCFITSEGKKSSRTSKLLSQLVVGKLAVGLFWDPGPLLSRFAGGKAEEGGETTESQRWRQWDAEIPGAALSAAGELSRE